MSLVITILGIIFLTCIIFIYKDIALKNKVLEEIDQYNKMLEQHDFLREKYNINSIFIKGSDSTCTACGSDASVIERPISMRLTKSIGGFRLFRKIS